MDNITIKRPRCDNCKEKDTFANKSRDYTIYKYNVIYKYVMYRYNIGWYVHIYLKHNMI